MYYSYLRSLHFTINLVAILIQTAPSVPFCPPRRYFRCHYYCLNIFAEKIWMRKKRLNCTVMFVVFCSVFPTSSLSVM